MSRAQPSRGSAIVIALIYAGPEVGVQAAGLQASSYWQARDRSLGHFQQECALLPPPGVSGPFPANPKVAVCVPAR